MFSCSLTMSSVVPETEKAADYQRACARKEVIRPDLQLTSLPSVWVQFDMADSVRAPDRKKREENQPSIRPAERDTERSLVVPFRGHIPGGLQPGKRIVMFGVVDPRPDRFYVALTGCCGTSGEPPSDVALELCIRFRDRQAIRRACMSGSWGDAERDVPFFPFIKDQPFKLEIRCERSRFRVFVDGEQLCDFQHRLTSLCHIDTMWIKGSVAVTKLA